MPNRHRPIRGTRRANRQQLGHVEGHRVDRANRGVARVGNVSKRIVDIRCGIRKREISVQVVRSGNDRVGGIVDAADDRLLPSEEDEAGVLVNRTSDRDAELVALERIDFVGEIVARVEGTIANKFERVAMPLVGAGLGNDVHHRAGVVAILCVEAVGLNAELLRNASGNGNGLFVLLIRSWLLAPSRL